MFECSLFLTISHLVNVVQNLKHFTIIGFEVALLSGVIVGLMESITTLFFASPFLGISILEIQLQWIFVHFIIILLPIVSRCRCCYFFLRFISNPNMDYTANLYIWDMRVEARKWIDLPCQKWLLLLLFLLIFRSFSFLFFVTFCQR